MKPEHDLLAHASRALRERHDGREAPAARTRERILASVRKQDKRRSFWFKASIPGGVLLLGTTAWAQATHQWPAVWRTVGDIFSLPVSSEGNSEQQLATGRATAPSATRSETTSNTLASADGVVDAGSATDTDVDSQATDTEASDVLLDTPTHADNPTPRGRRKKTLAQPALEEEHQLQPALSEPPEPPSEPEIAAFRAANDLDIKQRNLGAALSAYRVYLRDYPAGRFVPEARYNSAIILIKLGKRDEARRELTPFASGKYGAHRQARAAKLLQGLEQSEP